MGKAIFTRFFKDEKETTSLLNFPYISIIKPGIKKFNENKRYLATAEVDNTTINYDAPLIEYDNRESRANMQPINNSVWFAKMKNSIKHIFISTASDLLVNNYIFSTGFFGIKCEKIAYEYMVNYLKLPYFEVIKDKLAHGATQEAVNNEDLGSIKIQLPSRIKLEEFHNNTKTIYENISKIEEVTYRLSKMKNLLLPLLINGQLL